MATTYIQFTGRLKATSQEGIIAEAQQVAISSTDSTNVKTYIDNKIKEVQGNITSVAGSVYRPKGSLTVANFKALTSAAVGDVYNITEQFTLSGRTYPAYTNVACVKAFSAAVTPDDSYWDALGGTVDLSPYAKTADVNSKVDTINKSISDNVSSLTTKISTAQSTANTANSTANTNKTNISNLTTRVSTLEDSDHVNKINTVKVNGTALTPDSNKAVNIPLASSSASGLMSTDDKQKVDWSRTYIQQGDAQHPFLKGTLDAEAFTYNIGWMLDGYTYNNAVKIPLLNEEQAGLVDSQSYTDYIQPLLQGKYDENIDKKVDKVSGKGLSTNDYTTDEKNKLAGIASGANKYVLPAATASALGGVKVGAVDNNSISSYQGASTTLRNGVLMCDLVSDSKNGALSKTDYTAFKKTGTDLAALTTRMDNAESDINNLFNGDGNVIEKVRLNGTDLAVDSEKRVNLGTLVTDTQLFNRISGSSSVGSRVHIGLNTGNVQIDDNIRIGTGIYIMYDPELGGIKFGTEGVDSTYFFNYAYKSDFTSLNSAVTTLKSRVTALENLLKLA